MKITVLGAGAWGTALARLLHQGKNDVTLWGHNTEWLEEVRRSFRAELVVPYRGGLDLVRVADIRAPFRSSSARRADGP